MKSWNLLLAILLCLAGVARSDDKKASANEQVRFDGETLYLAFQGTDLKEYLLKGEKLESWTKLASIREFPMLHDPMAAAAELLRTLKQQNPQAPNSMIENKQTGEVMLDFVTWTDASVFVEFNVFKYSKKPGRGLVAQQYALREYKDIPTFLQRLKTVRLRLVDLMATKGLQAGN